MLRLLANLIIFASLLFFPWWVTLFLALAAVFFFKAFYEILAWALVGDFLYSTRTELFFNIQFVFTLCAAGIFFLAERTKKMTRFY